jgi:predicted dinucleotide-binding enzyme
MMRIGILGSGLMAEALGGQWVKAGHEVFVGGRDRTKATELAARIGAVGGSLQEASSFGAATLLAVHAEAVEEVLRAVGNGLAGTLIDCTNSIVPGEFTLAVPAMAERVAELATGAQVVKAFNLAPDAVWRNAPHDFRLGVPLCGDDPAAVEQVAVLVRALGCEPVPAGGLPRARLLEATAAFAIGVWKDGGDANSFFMPLAAF